VGSILLAGVFCLKWPAFCVGVELWPVLRGGGMVWGSDLWELGLDWKTLVSDHVKS
jgi:hypothetical protein